MSEKRQTTGTVAVILVTLAMVFYGISFPATRLVLEVYNPVTIITFRLIVSSLFLMVMNVAVNRRRALPVVRDLPLFLLIALFQPFLYFLFETYGLKSVSAAVASVIIATMPVVTPLFARVLIREVLLVQNIIGAVVSFLGVVLLVFSSFHEPGSGEMSAFGMLLIAGAMVSAVLYTIAVRKLPVHYSPITITAVQNTIGLLFFLPLFLVMESRAAFTVRPDGATVAAILVLALFASSLAFIFLNYGIQHLGPTRANGFVNLIPVITAVTSYLFFDETFTVMKIAGMVVVLAGVVVSQRGKRVRHKSA